MIFCLAFICRPVFPHKAVSVVLTESLCLGFCQLPESPQPAGANARSSSSSSSFTTDYGRPMRHSPHVLLTHASKSSPGHDFNHTHTRDTRTCLNNKARAAEFIFTRSTAQHKKGKVSRKGKGIGNEINSRGTRRSEVKQTGNALLSIKESQVIFQWSKKMHIAFFYQIKNPPICFCCVWELS